MCAVQNLPQDQQQNQQPVIPQPKLKHKFRWHIFFGIPLTIAIFLYIYANAKSSFSFEDIMRYLNVFYKEKYARLMCICAICIAGLAIAKLFKNKPQ